jgi:hypothetical protein
MKCDKAIPREIEFESQIQKGPFKNSTLAYVCALLIPTRLGAVCLQDPLGVEAVQRQYQELLQQS